MSKNNLTYKIPIRYFDIDANNHVNNSVYFTYMEEARTQLLMDKFIKWNEQGIIFVVTEAKCKYRLPITLHDNVYITISTSNITGVSFEVNYSFNDSSGILFAEGTTRMSCLNKNTQKLIRLPDDEIYFLSHLSK